MLIAHEHTRSIRFFDESPIHRQWDLCFLNEKRDQECAHRLRVLQETSFFADGTDQEYVHHIMCATRSIWFC